MLNSMWQFWTWQYSEKFNPFLSPDIISCLEQSHPSSIISFPVPGAPKIQESHEPVTSVMLMLISLCSWYDYGNTHMENNPERCKTGKQTHHT